MNVRIAKRVALATVLVASPAVGQEAEVVVSGGRVADGRGGERTGVSLSPALGWSDGRSQMVLRGAATLLEGGEPLWSGGVAGVVELAAAGPLSAEVAGGGELMAGDGWESAAGRISPRVGVSGVGWTVMAGPVWGVAGERFDTAEQDGGLLPLGGSAGSDSRSRASEGLTAEGRFFAEAGSLTGRWSGVRSQGATWQELGFGASSLVGSVVVGLEAGIRRGDVTDEWGGASAAIPLGSGAALLMEAGRYAADPLLDRPGGRYATLGLRIRARTNGTR